MGVTALHVAAGQGHSEIVKLLLTAGADTDIQDKVCVVTLNPDITVWSSLSCNTVELFRVCGCVMYEMTKCRNVTKSSLCPFCLVPYLVTYYHNTATLPLIISVCMLV